MSNKDLARQIIDNPHKLGHYFGYSLLTDLHSKWIKECFFNPEDNSLQAHRGSYKTTSIIVIGCIWWLWFNFEDRIAIIRKDFTAASEVLQVISKILNSDKAHILFKNIYGFDYSLTVNKNNTITWSLKKVNTPQGSISCYSMGEDMTGTHFDRMLIDDFVTIKDRISKAERESTKIFIQEIRANIIDPGKPIIFTGTPWHLLDAWTILPEPKKYDVYSSQIEKFNENYINHLKSVTTRSMFAANYELKHISAEDKIFSDPVYCKWDHSCAGVIGHIDAKYSGEHTGAFTMMSRRPDGKIQAIGFMFTKHIMDEYDNLISKWLNHKCGTVHLEDNADKGYAARDLSQKGMLTRSYRESENKFVKILQNLKACWHMIEWSDETDPEYMSQILDTAEGQEPDDCADSAASCLRESGIAFTGLLNTKVEVIKDRYNE